MKKVISLVLMIIIGILMLFGVGGADETKESSTTFTTGVFSEKDTNRFDYSFNYTIVSKDKLRLQYDYFFDNSSVTGYQRLWLNYENINLVKSQSLNVDFNPGFMLDNRERIYYGGITNIDLPKLKLHITSRNYAGNKIDKHFTFTTLGISKNFFVQHYYYMEKGWTSDSYIGPGANLGNLSVWGGISTNRPGGWAVDFSFSKKF